MLEKTDFQFIFPVDGDVLFSIADGKVIDNKLFTKVTVQAPNLSNIKINGVPAKEDHGIFTAEIFLNSYQNKIQLLDENTGYTETIQVLWLKNGYKTYRICVDDVIWCLEDIYKNKYHSIFENPFFKLFQELHHQYHNHVQMHVYYQNDDNSFNLSMFPDIYKQEFIDNSDWLQLTFHAFKNEPDRPYRHATYDQVIKDGTLVNNEILRFAGKEVMCRATAEHWADSNLETTKGFRDLGYQVLQAYFIFDENGNPDVSYYLNPEQTEHAAERDFWIDTKEDIIFLKDDIVLDSVKLEDIDGYLDLRSIENHKQQSFLNLLIHEEYFYEHYCLYQPEYREKVFKACQWAVDHGYSPAKVEDVIFQKGAF